MLGDQLHRHIGDLWDVRTGAQDWHIGLISASIRPGFRASFASALFPY